MAWLFLSTTVHAANLRLVCSISPNNMRQWITQVSSLHNYFKNGTSLSSLELKDKQKQDRKGIKYCKKNINADINLESGRFYSRSVTDLADKASIADDPKDVFVEGNVRDKQTLRKLQERKGVEEDADPSKASTVAVRIRRRLQQEAKQGDDGMKDDREVQTEKGKRKPGLRHQTKDLSRLDSNVVAKILKDRVIYNEGDIVAIDKPYGLPVHGGPGMGHSIASLLPQLARRLNNGNGGTEPELHLIHRLDKETTGVMLLARNERTARILHEMFRKRQMVKRYVVVTVGVPSPKEGIINMPMTETEIDGKHRMVVKPDLDNVLSSDQMIRLGQGRRRDGDIHQAITKYRVLSDHGNCALVQLEPQTGVKHQIRVHLAQGLGCPILGDHKYSHHNKLAPQKLPGSMLQVLGISQPKARTVPMHLHARQLVIPETFNNQNIFISTRAPWHFVHNMKKLKLKYDT